MPVRAAHAESASNIDGDLAWRIGIRQGTGAHGGVSSSGRATASRSRLGGASTGGPARRHHGARNDAASAAQVRVLANIGSSSSVEHGRSASSTVLAQAPQTFGIVEARTHQRDQRPQSE